MHSIHIKIFPLIWYFDGRVWKELSNLSNFHFVLDYATQWALVPRELRDRHAKTDDITNLRIEVFHHSIKNNSEQLFWFVNVT